MSFDKPTRNALAKMVGECRRLLTADIRDQLQRVYGLQPDGTELPVESLGHLDERAKQTAVELREWHKHLASTEAGSDVKGHATAFDRLAHETAFTAFNRLAALRLCEERGHVIECVRRSMESDGFKLFERLSGGALGSRATTYQAFLGRMFDELAVELGVLFDRRAPQSLVFPAEDCLEQVLTLLNNSSLAHLWQEDETIGWVYQYFNPKEERDAMRKASQAPRNSRELAVRNQFFTPRYVVEFLTDNTLGRIWYEMHRGETRLRDDCRYLVQRPKEIFLDPGQDPPREEGSEKHLSQREIFKLPAYSLFRAKKDPRDLKILDPACGSGHFLLYAFDLLTIIYAEAWADPDSPASDVTGKTLRENYSNFDTLRRELPSLILSHNLYGIEIDSRCCQIAALALWLRAQRSYQEIGLNAGSRPPITRSNIVCAEPMPGEQALLEEFVAELRPPLLAQLVRKIFSEMKLAGEAGSLLKIEEEIRDAIAEAKKQWATGPAPEQLLLLSEGNLRKAEQLGLFDVSGITDETFWAEAEARVIEGLQRYASKAMDSRRYRRRLFADDAAEGFAFVDLCRKRFDVALMNPAFGDFSRPFRDRAPILYPAAYNDMFGAFVYRGREMLEPGGQLGAITPRTGFFMTSARNWRKGLIMPPWRIQCFADLGEGVMDDAMVEAATYVLTRQDPRQARMHIPCVRVLGHEEKAEPLLSAIRALRVAETSPDLFLPHPEVFSALTDSPFVYWVRGVVLRQLASFATLEPKGGEVRKGLRTGDNFRFVRLLWELPPSEITANGKFEDAPDRREQLAWVPLVLSGASQPWYSPQLVVLNWRRNGKELREFVTKYGSPSRLIQAENYYLRAGISWTRRATRFVPYAVPSGCIPTGSRPMAFAQAGSEMLLLSLTASNVASSFMRFYGEKFLWPNFLEGKLKLVPWPSCPEPVRELLESKAMSEVEKRRRNYQTHEPYQEFVAPPRSISDHSDPLVFDMNSLLGADVERVVEKLYGLTAEDSNSLYRDLEEAVSVRKRHGEPSDDQGFEEPEADFVLSETPVDRTQRVLSYALGCAFGRWDIRFATGEKPIPELRDPFSSLAVCPPGMLQNAQGLPAGPSDLTPNYPLDISWQGIVVDDPERPEDIERRVRDAIRVIWTDLAGVVEQQVCEILGVQSLRDYLRRPADFFADHLRLYSKSRRQAPIYWPLSTASGLYTLWIYCHRLNNDLLYKAANDYLNPKIADTERRLKQIEDGLGSVLGRDATKLRQEFETTHALLEELHQFRAELLAVAALPYKPDLNDGVLVTAAPLWKLFRLPKWRKDLAECWKKLEAGEYDWAHLAYSIWPERVREKCKTDRSLAIAHGLEDLCEVAAVETSAKKRGRRGGRAIESTQINIEEMETKGSEE